MPVPTMDSNNGKTGTERWARYDNYGYIVVSMISEPSGPSHLDGLAGLVDPTGGAHFCISDTRFQAG